MKFCESHNYAINQLRWLKVRHVAAALACGEGCWVEYTNKLILGIVPQSHSRPVMAYAVYILTDSTRLLINTILCGTLYLCSQELCEVSKRSSPPT
jgi:hypothetical protein